MAVDAKICGLTRPRDAALAAEHGAWRLGVIFAGGPRLIDVERAREIVSAADGVPVIGVFGGQSVGTILKTAIAAGLAGVQLHGTYSTDEARQLSGNGMEVWRVARLDGSPPRVERLAELSRAADAVLVEPGRPGELGGKGMALPLLLAREARLALPRVMFVLAGGLTPESVAEAIRVVQPEAVDVSSGVESSHGIKDSARLIRFLENVRATRPSA